MRIVRDPVTRLEKYRLDFHVEIPKRVVNCREPTAIEPSTLSPNSYVAFSIELICDDVLKS
ncbi:hypothetical protein GGE62_006106 [Rhizobium leguminosarum]|nr:hypothetical protein [Rhizobium leguminosarum]